MDEDVPDHLRGIVASQRLEIFRLRQRLVRRSQTLEFYEDLNAELRKELDEMRAQRDKWQSKAERARDKLIQYTDWVPHA